MLSNMILVLSLVNTWGFGHGFLCGEPPLCHCILDMGILTCMDSTIEYFPTFNESEKSDIALIDIANTLISTLPVFERNDWPLLQMLDIRHNNRMDICGEFLMELVPKDIALLTDCTNVHNTSTTPLYGVGHEDQLTIILSSVIATPLISFIAAFRIYLIILRRRQASNVIPQEEAAQALQTGINTGVV